MAENLSQLLYSLSPEKSLLFKQSSNNEIASPAQLQLQKSGELIEKIDVLLGGYYSSHGRSYFDENGKGMFYKFCSENGYDDITVDEELKSDPQDCMLLDFDETDEGFPALVSPNNLLSTKFDIVKKCYKDREPFKNCKFADYDFKISYKMFNVDPLLIEKVSEWHSKHCCTISKLSESSFQLLAIGCVINQPYFQLLADTFSRYRLKIIKRWPKHKPIPNDAILKDFIRQNKHCLELDRTSGNNKCTTIIYNALQEWIKEFRPIKPPYCNIVDDVERITKLIAMAIEFVSNLAKTENVPFQWDYNIAFNKCGWVDTNVTNNKEDEFEEEYTNDDDDDELYIRNNQKQSAINADWLSDVSTRLKKHNLKLQMNELVTDKYIVSSMEKEYILCSIIRKNKIFVPTSLIHLICNFMGKLIGSHCDYYKDYVKVFDDFLKVVDEPNYPKNKRFCAFVDNRDPNNIKRGIYGNHNFYGNHVTDTVFENDNMDVIFYEPPDANFPVEYSMQSRHNLFCFHSAAKFILPGTGHAHFPSNINSKTFLKGEMLTLSFHVQSEEEIRCYFYINGSMLRFFPQDIMDFLCTSFVENEKNSHFIKSDAMKQMIQRMNSQLRDERFRVFTAKHR